MKQVKFESWQLFYAAQKALGAAHLAKIYTRSTRLIHLWAANPRYCAETARNPLDRIRIMLQELDLAGLGHISEASLNYLGEPINRKCVPIEAEASDKGTVDGEIADLAMALGVLADEVRGAISDGVIDTSELIRIKHAARRLKAEADQLLDAAGIKGGA